MTIHVPSTPGRAWNMLVALQAGSLGKKANHAG